MIRALKIIFNIKEKPKQVTIFTVIDELLDVKYQYPIPSYKNKELKK